MSKIMKVNCEDKSCKFHNKNNTCKLDEIFIECSMVTGQTICVCCEEKEDE